MSEEDAEPCVIFCPGLTVVTRSPDSNNVTSSAVGTALPKFAIRGMLKTFGLHGVVLDVDSVSKDVWEGHLMHLYLYFCVQL